MSNKMKKLMVCALLLALLLVGILLYRQTHLFKENDSDSSTPMPASTSEMTPEGTPEPEITPTPEPTPTYTPMPVVKGDIPERSYESHREFPYEDMEFVDDEAFAFLKEAYEAIDFYGEFEIGDEELYGDYIKKYKKLVDNEIPFTIDGKEYYLSKYKWLRAYSDEEYDPREFTYYLFDMDGDSTPELCIWNNATYVFKYDTVSDRIILWSSFESPNESIHGTKMVSWNWDGMRDGIYKFDEKGEMIFYVFFLVEATWSNGNDTYMLMVPSYEGEPIEIPWKIKEQAYFSEENSSYHFKVTEEQFDQLTGDYFKACEQSEKNIKRVSYTYDELFENYDEQAASKKADDASEEKKVIPEGARELLEYLFNYLYEDQSNMVEIELHETEDELYYKWKIKFSTGEISDSNVLKYSYSIRDGLYHEFAAYTEVWETYYDKEGIEYEEYLVDDYENSWLVNSVTKEVTPQKIYNEDAEDEADHYIQNEKYWEIICSRAEGNK